MVRGCVRAGLTLAVIVLVGCDAPDEALDAGGLEADASVLADAGPILEADAGELDAGPTVEVDAGEFDAGQPTIDARVGEPDAGPVDERDAGPIVEADAGAPPVCDIYADDRCTECGRYNDMIRTCRLSRETGLAECQIAGTTREHRPCRRDTDCSCGLFCNAGWGCTRYCDPEGDPCPDTHSGTPQRCVQNAASGLFYCAK